MRFPGILLLLGCLGACASAQDLALVHANVYASPDAAVMADAVVLIREGKIAAVGQRLPVPAGIPRLDLAGATVVAGFWNSHVHFSEPKWADANHIPAATLERQLQDFVTRSGFTTVVDTGSLTVNTVAIRRRIESGEIAGPRIYTAGIPLYPLHALPFYLNDLPAAVRNQLHQPASPDEAVTAVRQNIADGADLTKLFTGSIVAPDHIVPMSIPIATAAVAEAHRHGQLVFSHSTNLAGTNAALAAGVDVLAHSPELLTGIDDDYVRRLVDKHVSIIPTLKLFSQDANIADIRNVLFRFHRLGGVLLFGTDTGYLTDYDVAEEYRQLALAGFNYREILAMLTTAPAARFRVANRSGRVEPGYDADLTILASDPGSGDPLAFTQVKWVIRRGRVIFAADGRARYGADH